MVVLLLTVGLSSTSLLSGGQADSWSSSLKRRSQHFKGEAGGPATNCRLLNWDLCQQTLLVEIFPWKKQPDVAGQKLLSSSQARYFPSSCNPAHGLFHNWVQVTSEVCWYSNEFIHTNRESVLAAAQRPCCFTQAKSYFFFCYLMKTRPSSFLLYSTIKMHTSFADLM